MRRDVAEAEQQKNSHTVIVPINSSPVSDANENLQCQPAVRCWDCRIILKLQTDSLSSSWSLSGIDLVSRWQLSLTSSWNRPKSYTASATSSVCGEFVTGDCLSDGINRHHCPPSQWRYKLPLMQIFTERTKKIHFLPHRPPSDAPQRARAAGWLQERPPLLCCSQKDPVNINQYRDIGTRCFCHHHQVELHSGHFLESLSSQILVKLLFQPVTLMNPTYEPIMWNTGHLTLLLPLWLMFY